MRTLVACLVTLLVVMAGNSFAQQGGYNQAWMVFNPVATALTADSCSVKLDTRYADWVQISATCSTGSNAGIYPQILVSADGIVFDTLLLHYANKGQPDSLDTANDHFLFILNRNGHLFVDSLNVETDNTAGYISAAGAAVVNKPILQNWLKVFMHEGEAAASWRGRVIVTMHNSKLVQSNRSLMLF